MCAAGAENGGLFDENPVMAAFSLVERGKKGDKQAAG